MDNQNPIKAHIPMSETAFYILLSLTEPKHGYGVMLHVESLTAKRISLGAGTLYGSISKMERSGLISFIGEESKRKIYQITAFGKEVLRTEIQRISELYFNSKGAMLQ